MSSLHRDSRSIGSTSWRMRGSRQMGCQWGQLRKVSKASSRWERQSLVGNREYSVVSGTHRFETVSPGKSFPLEGEKKGLGQSLWDRKGTFTGTTAALPGSPAHKQQAPAKSRPAGRIGQEEWGGCPASSAGGKSASVSRELSWSPGPLPRQRLHLSTKSTELLPHPHQHLSHLYLYRLGGGLFLSKSVG